jgi:hypothetical protein
MTVPTRSAGWGVGADGSSVTWTVAEGRKGRRWREVLTRDGAVLHALLLETDADRRFSHLELARADGLWTFHPEPDGTLHGNHVGSGDGGADVRHVAGWPYGPEDELLVAGSSISFAAVAWRRESAMVEGATAVVAGVVIGSDGELAKLPDLRIERLSMTTWQVGEGSPFEIDDAGLPILRGGISHPLELA